MRRVLAVALTLAIIAQPLSAVGAAAQSDPTIERTMTLSLTPERPGSVDVRVEYDVPSNLESLTTTVPATATVRKTTGFVEDGGNYTWHAGGAGPSLTLTVEANRTGVGLRAASSDTGYEFVDTGSWAIVTTPRMSTYWTYVGSNPSFVSHIRTDGPGVAGERMVYLGPSTQYERSLEGQRVTLVDPAAASLHETPTAVLDSIEAASTSMRVRERDPALTFVAAPTTVEWAAAGLAADADAWVRADARLDTPNNVWLHEYAHTRIDFEPAENARWLIEASAEYYAASTTLQQGRIDFQEFAEHLRQGRERFDSSIMTRPGTWEPGAQYLKGALILGTVDRRMRLVTESSRSVDALIREINERDPIVTHTFVRSTVASLAGQETADHLHRYATTTAAPDMWSWSEHREAFSTLPPRFAVSDDPTYEIRGPYRETSTDSIPTLVPGETLTVRATVTNVGGAEGAFQIPLSVDGSTVDVATGTLAPGASSTVELSTTVSSPGTRTLVLDGVRTDLRVMEPASPRVTSLAVTDENLSTDRPVPVSLTATNPTDRPASGDVQVFVDGVVKATWAPIIGPGESRSTTVALSIDRPGDHTIRAGGESVQVSLRGSHGITGVAVPGFTVNGTLAAIVLVSVLGVLSGRRQ
ncbi:MAG: CARDB domain-containing protein [Halanaeroarchaeum sp.]